MSFTNPALPLREVCKVTLLHVIIILLILCSKSFIKTISILHTLYVEM